MRARFSKTALSNLKRAESGRMTNNHNGRICIYPSIPIPFFRYLCRYFVIMKKWTLVFSLLIAATAFAQEGYEIRVTFKPYTRQYVYLGHYFGKQYPIIDSVLLDANSQAIFRGNKKLPGGIYLIGYPNKTGFFEILVDKQQVFSVIADTLTLNKTGVQFLNSSDNELFRNYQQSMMVKGREMAAAKENLKNAATPEDTKKWNAEITRLDQEIRSYREDLIKKNPGSLLSALLLAMREPELPEALKVQQTRKDSLAAYQYYKSHYWDAVNFWDGRLAYTTFLEDRVDKYFNQLVAFQPDSVIKEMDYMLGYATNNPEMTKFLLLKFVNRYLNQKYMWEDAVFVHLFEKYFAAKSYEWLNEKGYKTITDRAYSLMANIMGTPAAEIELPDSTGKPVSLYAQNSAYTLICFWDPTCGHCKEVLPKLDSFYVNKWKAAGLKIYAVARETDGSKKDWLNFINSHHLHGWAHVYYSKADDKARINAGVPGYSQLYDVLTFPTLYLLDKDKRIVAKKLSYEQMDEVLDVKLKGQ
jgi:thiol-disulfide isomerase/thioredoxin